MTKKSAPKDDEILFYDADEPPIPEPTFEMTLILGVGSPFGSDQAGWKAIDQLLLRPEVKIAVENGTWVVQKLDRPGMALLEIMQGFSHVIVIDAVMSDDYPTGAWLTLAREELALLASPASTHGIGVAEALAMGEALNMLPKQLDVWGVVVNSLS